MVEKCQAKRGISDIKISNSFFAEDTGFVIAPYQTLFLIGRIKTLAINFIFMGPCIVNQI